MDLLVIALVVVLIVVLVRSQRAQVRPDSGGGRADAERRWQAVRRVAEEDVTQLGQQIADMPVAADLPAEGRQDFDDALAAYERAKEALAAAQHPDDLQWVTRSIDDGRFALARLAARRNAEPLPSRRAPCFFDQRHGLSVQDASWQPDGAAARDVPVCAACAALLADGQDPQVRMVPTPTGVRPYYDAGPEYGPWARGWYAASGLHVMNSALLGMLLLNSMYLPPGFDYGDPGADVGGDAGGEGDYGGDGGGFGDFGDF